jgi:hypothetical protein
MGAFMIELLLFAAVASSWDWTAPSFWMTASIAGRGQEGRLGIQYTVSLIRPKGFKPMNQRKDLAQDDPPV